MTESPGETAMRLWNTYLSTPKKLEKLHGIRNFLFALAQEQLVKDGVREIPMNAQTFKNLPEHELVVILAVIEGNLQDDSARATAELKQLNAKLKKLVDLVVQKRLIASDPSLDTLVAQASTYQRR